MPSELQVANLALAQLKASRIESLTTDTSFAGVLVAEYWPVVRDAVLEEAPWRFATIREELAADASEPGWGSGSVFLVPAASVRVLEVRSNDIWDAPDSLKWQLTADGEIVANAETVYVRYVSNAIASTMWSNMFALALSTRLAAELAMPITGSQKLEAQAWKLYEIKMRQARRANSAQGSSRTVYASTLTDARRS